VGVQPDAIKPVDYGALAIELMWSYALVLPFVVLCLPPPVQQAVILLVAFVSLALIVTWRYNDNHKR
jgi:hypothetical protein